MRLLPVEAGETALVQEAGQPAQLPLEARDEMRERRARRPAFLGTHGGPRRTRLVENRSELGNLRGETVAELGRGRDHD